MMMLSINRPVKYSWPVIWFLIGLILMIGVSGCRLFPKERVEDVPALVQPPQEELVTQEITVGPIDEELSGTARVGSSKEQTLYFLTPGRIFDVLVEYGQMVKAGQPLVRIDTGELEYTVKQAKLNLDQEQLRFEQQFGDNSDNKREILLAGLNLARAKLDLEQARERLKVEGFSSAGLRKKVLERDVKRAELTLRQNQLNYDHLLAQSAPDSLERKIAALGVERARLEYERLSTQLDRAMLRAPFDGKIISLNSSRGRNIEAFAPVVTIANMKGLELISEVSVNNVMRLKPGMKVHIELDEGKSQTGNIVLIDKPQGANSDQDIWLGHIRMEGPRFPLKMDNYYTVTYILRSVKKALLVPNDAVREDVNGKRYLRVIDGKQRRDVYIKTGIENGTMTQILEGAATGMTVIGR